VWDGVESVPTINHFKLSKNSGFQPWTRLAPVSAIGRPGNFAQNLVMSNFGNKVAEPHFEGFGDAHQGIDAGGFLAAFKFTQVHGMQVRLFSKLFLAQTGALPMPPYGLADDFLMSQRPSHASLSNQKRGCQNTVRSP
jgi:hypothetical protein